MGMPQSKHLYTADEYLVLERFSENRHLYLDGNIFDMAGESNAHGDITMNLAGVVQAQLRGTPCRGRTKDTKIRSGLGPLSGRSVKGMFSYPDIAVICGELEFHDAHKDVILNPTAIMEVLSPSTEAFDRGEKFSRYQAWNPTLTDYVLVSQDKPQIEHFARQPDDTWLYRRYEGLDVSVAIASIGCTLKLADVYDRVDFRGTEETQP
jgi:Uma2 family endonuclease